MQRLTATCTMAAGIFAESFTVARFGFSLRTATLRRRSAPVSRALTMQWSRDLDALEVLAFA